ncbi:hypothetical protein M3Y99_00316600 [Aphelenchoides fujianensis]|nr:hypothetical protein M3Y99_00316600 [Aphelenchoides fujianensis]
MNGKQNGEVASQRSYGGNIYHAAPSMPTLEISINQHNPPPMASPYQVSSISDHTPTPPAKRNPPLTAPPPPPIPRSPQPARNPTYSHNNHYNYPESDHWINRIPQRKNLVMFYLCLIQLILAAVVLAGGVWCSQENTEYCPYYSAIWTAVVFIINSAVGLVAARIGAEKAYLGHLALSCVSFMLCIAGCILAARNWFLVGTYSHPTISRNDAYCILGEHDAPRVSHIFSHMEKYNFRQCLYAVKVGLAVNSIQFVFTLFIGILEFVSALMCLRRLCRKK